MLAASARHWARAARRALARCYLAGLLTGFAGPSGSLIAALGVAAVAGRSGGATRHRVDVRAARRGRLRHRSRDDHSVLSCAASTPAALAHGGRRGQRRAGRVRGRRCRRVRARVALGRSGTSARRRSRHRGRRRGSHAARRTDRSREHHAPRGARCSFGGDKRPVARSTEPSAATRRSCARCSSRTGVSSPQCATASRPPGWRTFSPSPDCTSASCAGHRNRVATRRRAPFANVLTIAAVVVYVAVIGAPIPAVRAAIMLNAFLASRLAQRPTSRWAIVALVRRSRSSTASRARCRYQLRRRSRR